MNLYNHAIISHNTGRLPGVGASYVVDKVKMVTIFTWFKGHILFRLQPGKI